MLHTFKSIHKIQSKHSLRSRFVKKTHDKIFHVEKLLHKSYVWPVKAILADTGGPLIVENHSEKKNNNFTYRMAGFLRSKAVICWGQRKIARERKEAVSFG